MIKDIEGLTRRQVAELGSLIGEAHYRAEDFDSDEDLYVGPNSAPGIVHRPTKSTFAIGRHLEQRGYGRALSDLGHAVQFSPGGQQPRERRGPLQWEGVRDAFRDWLAFIAAEFTAQDFLTAARAAMTKTAVGPDPQAGEPFTPTERQALEQELATIEATLRRVVEGQSATDALIQSELAALREELKTMQRGRWKTMAMGSLGSLVTHGVPPEVVNHAWTNLGHFLDQLPRMLRRG